MDRRGFMGSILALAAAPAIVRAGSLMRIIVPSAEEVWEITQGTVPESFTGEELLRVTRRATGPPLFTQIYENTPLVMRLIEMANSTGRI